MPFFAPGIEPFWLFHVDLPFQLSIEVGISNVKTREVPTLKCSQSEDEAHSLESHNRGEDLVEILSFNLGEALCYEAGSFSPIGFNIEDPSVFYDSAATWAHYHVKDMVFGEGLYFLLACSSPFL